MVTTTIPRDLADQAETLDLKWSECLKYGIRAKIAQKAGAPTDADLQDYVKKLEEEINKAGVRKARMWSIIRDCKDCYNKFFERADGND